MKIGETKTPIGWYGFFREYFHSDMIITGTELS